MVTAKGTGQSLVTELRSHVLHSAAKKKENQALLLINIYQVCTVQGILCLVKGHVEV